MTNTTIPDGAREAADAELDLEGVSRAFNERTGLAVHLYTESEVAKWKAVAERLGGIAKEMRERLFKSPINAARGMLPMGLCDFERYDSILTTYTQLANETKEKGKG